MCRSRNRLKPAENQETKSRPDVPYYLTGHRSIRWEHLPGKFPPAEKQDNRYSIVESPSPPKTQHRQRQLVASSPTNARFARLGQPEKQALATDRCVRHSRWTF